MKTLLAILLALAPGAAIAKCVGGSCSISTRPTLFGGTRTVIRSTAPVTSYVAPVVRYSASYNVTPPGETFLHWGPPTAGDYAAAGMLPPEPTVAPPYMASKAAPASCEGCECQDRIEALEARVKLLEDTRNIFSPVPKREVSAKRELSEAIATYRPSREIPLTLAVR
jgi:hypothetical protein